MENSHIKEVYFTRLFQDLWLKEVISPIRMGQEAKVSMAKILKTKIFGTPIHTKESFQWPTLALIQTILNL